MQWHERLLARLKELGWTQVELARRAKLSDPDKLYKWLDGKVRNPRGSDFEEVAKAVGWTEQELRYGPKDRPDENIESGVQPAMRLPLYEWEDLQMLGVPGRKIAQKQA